MPRFRLLGTAFSLGACLTISAPGASLAQAADYPTRPIRVVVPAPPGGTNDLVARVLAERLARRLGKSVVVENRGGGNGELGAEQVVRAAPDGYTLLASSQTPLVIGELLNPQQSYRVKDLAPISLLAEVPVVLVGRPDYPARSIKDFVGLARQQPGAVRVAIGGVGGVSHLLTERLRSAEKLDLNLVPYQGSGPAVKDQLGGHTDVHFEPVPAVISYLKSGHLLALGIAAPQRSPLLPEVATAAEQGYPDLIGTVWFALAAPVGTPADIVAKLNAEVAKVLQDSETQEALARAGATAKWGTPAETAAYIASEHGRWGEIIKTANISLK